MLLTDDGAWALAGAPDLCLGPLLWGTKAVLAVPRPVPAGQWEEAGNTRGSAAAPAPPGLFPAHCPGRRKDVSSLLPFCLKGMWGGQGTGGGLLCKRQEWPLLQDPMRDVCGGRGNSPLDG